MKYIWLGIKDYCKDCWHDWHLHHIEKSIGNEPLFCMAKDEDAWIAMIDWKEGNLWHYIRQRKHAKKITKWNIQDYLKTKKDLANYLESALEENDYEFLKIAVKDIITALQKKKK